MTDDNDSRAYPSGVKADDGASPLTRKQVRLDAETEAVFAKIGKGNVSLGAREAARRLIEHKDTGGFDLARHAKRSRNT